MNKNWQNFMREGYARARAITRHHAKTFYFASRFLPRKQQEAACAIYALCRIADDAVDTSSYHSASAKIGQVERSLESVFSDAPLPDSVLSAFKQTVTIYQIPQHYFNELVRGMYMDLTKHRYQNFEELYSYCLRVAGVVGLIMLKIFGVHSQEMEKRAVELGIAMQLTNILRDIKEDYARGRIYLPVEEMERFQVSEHHIARGMVDGRFISLMQFQVERARQYYRSAARGIPLLDGVLTRFVISLMSELYAGILNAIEEKHYDVFSQRVHVGNARKVLTALRLMMRRRSR